MTTYAPGSVEDLFDGQISINQPLDWEFLGTLPGETRCAPWSRWESYATGECISLPNGEIWCAKRTVNPGDAGPGERGWSHAWERYADHSTLVGADSAAERAHRERYHGRGTSVGADLAAERAHRERYHGRGTSVGADPAAERAHRERYHGRGTLVGAYVADLHAIRQAMQDQASPELLGADPVTQATHSTQRVLERARDMRSPSLPPARVVHIEDSTIDIDPTREEIVGEVDLAPVHYEILGEVDLAPVHYEILGRGGDLDERDFPLTQDLYAHFRNQGQPKFVRLDTEESYRDFRAGQSPALAELRERVAALEAFMRRHTQDGHGAEQAILGLASDISQLQSAHAEERVPIQMPPWAEGCYDCWRTEGPDGGLICSSVALPGHDGYVRICTAASPIRPHVEDMVGYTRDVGCDVATLLGVLPALSCMLGGGRLIQEICAAAPAVLAHPAARRQEPFVGQIVPANRPTLAALMALFQHAQAGNPQAVREWRVLADRAGANPNLATCMAEARRRVIAGQSAQGGAAKKSTWASLLGWSRR